MKTRILPALAIALFAVAASHAAAPANAPAGSSGLCKDGTFHEGAEKKGACRGHEGVKEWWGPAKGDAKPAGKADAKPGTMAASAPAAPAATTAAATPPKPPSAGGSTAARKMPAKPETITAAPGGGAGLVWVNESSKVYHCQGDKWYGKTKHGEYMKEADAKAKGMKGSGGKACAA